MLYLTLAALVLLLLQGILGRLTLMFLLKMLSVLLLWIIVILFILLLVLNTCSLKFVWLLTLWPPLYFLELGLSLLYRSETPYSLFALVISVRLITPLFSTIWLKHHLTLLVFLMGSSLPELWNPIMCLSVLFLLFLLNNSIMWLSFLVWITFSLIMHWFKSQRTDCSIGTLFFL